MSQTLLLVIGSACLGAIGGSFLNAFLSRFGTGRSIVRGRSRCMHCDHQLGAFDLIPIFSYLLLQGKCRYCSVRISPQYLIIEVVAATLSLGVYLVVGLSPWYLFWFLVWMLLLCIAVYDLRHTIIPTPFLITFGVLALVYICLTHAYGNLLSAIVLASPLLLLSLISQGRWMGWADGFLELSLGAFLGTCLGLTAFLIAFWSGALIGLALLLVSRTWKDSHSRFTMKSEIPFAPFLILGALVVYFFHVNFFSPLSYLHF